ncbi:putative phage tail protein [Aureimonas altamirensis]|uniref:putative phage tail protein n=1 Tax=Aureimonas altamirensis TaxID=370622 RepID=UPI00068B5815|nr:putative phage tail protein [Aureimonas altamirensis]
MSTFYVIDGHGEYYVLDGSPVIYVPAGDVIRELDLDTGDALSSPTVEDLLPSGAALWPRGAAWGSPDGMAMSASSVLSGFTRALLGPFADAYARSWKLTLEARSATLQSSLSEWEADYGLPEPCAVNVQSDGERWRFLRAKVASDGYISPEDFVRLAAFLGYFVAVEEPDAFRAGESSCGSYDEVSDVALEQQWVVHVRDMPIEQFEVGVGETGVTPLLDYDAGALECVVRRAAPAWTYPYFNYVGWPTSLLTTEGGQNILTDDDDTIIV